MLRPLLLFALIIIVAEPSVAQIRATTEGGNNVLLFDNGTWKYDEKSGNTAENSAKPVEVVAVATIVVDSTKIYVTKPEELFYLPSPRLVKYFGNSGGNIRCKLSCANSLGMIKIHLMWEIPVSDGDRYFGWFKEGSKVTLTLDDGQILEIVMGDESAFKRYENRNYSMISNTSLPLSTTQIAALCAQGIRKMEVGWKKDPEQYDLGLSRVLMEMLPTVF